MKSTYSIFCVVCLLLIFSCKKEKIDVGAQLAGRWKVDNLVDKLFVDDIEQYSLGTTTTGTVADYVEFTADGKVIRQLAGDTETGIYLFDKANRKVNLDGKIYSFLEFSESKLVLRAIDSQRYGDHSVRNESTLSLKK